MKLEDQLNRLSEIGLSLNSGITINDLLLSFPREDYEEAPFDLVLFALGSEVEEAPWGRYVCDRAWNFDVEAIEDNGSYVTIVEQFHRITGKAKPISDLTDRVDIDGGVAELRYKVDGQQMHYLPKIDDDWADPNIIEAVMNDLKQPGYEFYPKDNGQASIWFYLNEQEALALNELANNVFGLKQKPWWKIW